MFEKDDNTFQNLRENSVNEWLNEMSEHNDLAVRGGVKATREYIESLKLKIANLEEKNGLKDAYLKKLKDKFSEVQ